MQLRERHWRIFSLSGTLETVRGRGVVGQEPALTRTLPAFQYSSHVSLQAPSGHMWYVWMLLMSKGIFQYFLLGALSEWSGRMVIRLIVGYPRFL